MSEVRTILTVYAGPHKRTVVLDESAGEGDIMWRSGIRPPWDEPSLIRASEISQVEN
jgi:hypothetical protein